MQEDSQSSEPLSSAAEDVIINPFALFSVKLFLSVFRSSCFLSRGVVQCLSRVFCQSYTIQSTANIFVSFFKNVSDIRSMHNVYCLCFESMENLTITIKEKVNNNSRINQKSNTEICVSAASSECKVSTNGEHP